MAHRKYHRSHRRPLPFEHVGVRHGDDRYHGFDDYDIRYRTEGGYEDCGTYESPDYEWYEHQHEHDDYEREEPRTHYHENPSRGPHFAKPRHYPQRWQHGLPSYGHHPGYHMGNPYAYEQREERPRREYHSSYSHVPYDEEQGHHQGKGPKHWTRSDERISDDINQYLTDDAYLDATNIVVDVKGGEVTLSGNVDSRRAKRYAEDLAEQITGVTQVHNELRVESSEEGAYETRETKTTKRSSNR